MTRNRFFGACIAMTMTFSFTDAAFGVESASRLVRLEPLSIRGMNYYPRETSWSGMWLATEPTVWDKDMDLMASLGVNTVRTFLHFGSKQRENGLVRSNGEPSDAYLAKIDRFLSSAWVRGIRVVPCFEFDEVATAAQPGGPSWKRGLTGVLARFKGDGRILMVDLKNEPDDSKKWNSNTRVYLAEGARAAEAVDPGLLTTIGFAYRTDRLAEIPLPKVLQWHEYAPKENLFEMGPARVLKSLSNQRLVGGSLPVFIGEFGMSTARDAKYGCAPASVEKLAKTSGTESEQERLYGIVLDAAEAASMPGVMAWCLHDYPIGNPNEAFFGLVRGDGSLKPAARVLQERYRRWAERNRVR